MDNEKNTNSRNQDNLWAAMRKIMDNRNSTNKEDENKEAGNTDDILAKLENGENPISSVPTYRTKPKGLSVMPNSPGPKHLVTARMCRPPKKRSRHEKNDTKEK